MVNDKNLLKKYVQLAQAEKNVTFAGRLGTYRYMDMDVTIREAMDLAMQLISDINSQQTLKSFYHQEIGA